MTRVDCGGSPTPIPEVLKHYPWLLPIFWIITRGVEEPGEITLETVSGRLGVPKRLARTLVHYAVKAGILHRSGGSYKAYAPACIDVIDVRRKGRYYAAVVGDTVYVAKTLSRRVRWFTVPREHIGELETLEGKARYRAVVAKKVLGDM
ncbi:hypothetical protein APE_1617 [Aeropyrum pernix K1]|uniref:Uncharacterized protein n=1 Tax=Aeropyrum pernix (strain ATCC 700893 / DSM 11879 / JCM 9820 / NBRC 100138 / K1) TaxID=272557 RepID=Q9YBI1_AERPE|nr:hypothetical protein [Aeropyrum pernix]BAA80617.1 hypothetical protein APE_1617 [Aeropyrum pernix K1]